MQHIHCKAKAYDGGVLLRKSPGGHRDHRTGAKLRDGWNAKGIWRAQATPVELVAAYRPRHQKFADWLGTKHPRARDLQPPRSLPPENVDRQLHREAVPVGAEATN